MKVYSLWQPYASLAVLGYKFHETRGFPPPTTLKVGERFAIAATKQIKANQRAAVADVRMQHHLQRLGLLEWEKLPRGAIIGTAVLGNAFQITREHVIALQEREYVFGDWHIGRWAWPLHDARLLHESIPVRGHQGIWSYGVTEVEG